MFVELDGMVWFDSMWFGSTWIESEFFDSSLILSWCYYNLQSYFHAHHFLEILLSPRFSTSFLLSLFIVLCLWETFITKTKMLQLISMVQLIFGCGLPMVLDGFVPFFNLRSTLNQHSFCYHFSDSQQGSPNHRIPIYQLKRLLS